jgi:hypothetical protein
MWTARRDGRSIRPLFFLYACIVVTVIVVTVLKVYRTDQLDDHALDGKYLGYLCASNESLVDVLSSLCYTEPYEKQLVKVVLIV